MNLLYNVKDVLPISVEKMADAYAIKDLRSNVHWENKTIVVHPSFLKFCLSPEAKEYFTKDYDCTEFEKMFKSGYSFVKGMNLI